MALSSSLVSDFAKAVKSKATGKNESTVYGTAVEYNGRMYARLDGADRLTPIESTASIKAGDRVIILIKNHTATVTGSTTNPSANSGDLYEVDNKVYEIGSKISEFEIVIADKVSVKEFDALTGRVGSLEADNLYVKDKLTANDALIGDLEADNVEINNKLDAAEANIEHLTATKLDAETAELTFATIEELDVTNANIHNLESTFGDFEVLTTNKFEAVDADIKKLDTEKLSATDADLKYANIDFSNIDKAAMEYFYAQSGLIDNVVIGDATISGELVGVTISGDLIKGNTIVADKLVIKGSDGLYYKLNTDGMTVEKEQTDYNSLNGQVIRAKSITATKIDVNDLVAFDATIGGFNITQNSIYSGVKETVDNTTRGIYLDKTGQMSIGDGTNYIRYYKGADDKYHLAISADELVLSSGGSISNEFDEIRDEMNENISRLEDEISTILYIDSSMGNVFKNDQVSTVLTVIVLRGTKRITDIDSLKAEFGQGAYLEWSWKRMNDEDYGIISADDERIGNNGFTFTVSPDDVDTKVIFECNLISD